MLLLIACAGHPTESALPSDDSAASAIPTAYEVHWSTSPDPIIAGSEAQFTLTITDQDGHPIDDLQQEHQRMVHAIFISDDLSDFQHRHQEDTTPITAENLRTATYSLPLTLQHSGLYWLGFDYAHLNAYLHSEDQLQAEGDAPQGSQDLAPIAEASDQGVHGVLSWEVSPIAGYEAAFFVTLSDENTGEPITDVGQWLGADAHAITTDSQHRAIGHTHAWFPGMETAPPGHDMPHQYTGPDIPFHYTFLAADTYKIWVQLARESAPDQVITLPFVFEVSP